MLLILCSLAKGGEFQAWARRWHRRDFPSTSPADFTLPRAPAPNKGQTLFIFWLLLEWVSESMTSNCKVSHLSLSEAKDSVWLMDISISRNNKKCGNPSAAPVALHPFMESLAATYWAPVMWSALRLPWRHRLSWSFWPRCPWPWA